MRTWNNKLYFGALPGRTTAGRPQGDFGLWLQEMAANKIRTVVCLTPEPQIAAESPEYAEWRRRQRNELEGRAATDDGQFELIDVPIDDFQAPEPSVAGRFWRTAKEIAERIENGDRVFVHCAAGIGRTGMFAVAVLMRQGFGYEEAYKQINAVGSGPEVPAQREFLKRGLTPGE